MSVTEAKLDAVRAAVEPAVHALGLDVYDIELLGGAGARTLRLTVTRASGVDLDAITAVTRAVSPLLDRESPAPAVNGPYLLEVSSPGVERALRRHEHFTGALGEQVSIKYHTETGPRRVRGALTRVGGEQLAVDVDGVTVEIPLAAVVQARTVFEWGPTPRPSQRKSGKTRARAKETR